MLEVVESDYIVKLIVYLRVDKTGIGECVKTLRPRNIKVRKHTRFTSGNKKYWLFSYAQQDYKKYRNIITSGRKVECIVLKGDGLNRYIIFAHEL